MNNINIAILEDQQQYAKILHEMLTSWAAAHNTALQITLFSNGNDLLLHATAFQVIFIDIQLKHEQNGMEIAKYLRHQAYHGDIVFTTSFRDYSLEGYEVQALQYLIKPVSKEKLERTMNIVLDKLQPSYHSIFYRNELLRIEHASISYLASSNHYIDLYKLNCPQPISYRGRFQDEVQKFPSDFKQCHRSILVNMNHVTSIKGKDLFLADGTVLPVSPSYLDSIRNTLLHILNT